MVQDCVQIFNIYIVITQLQIVCSVMEDGSAGDCRSVEFARCALWAS